ncbi:MAG: SGNH/GDSL hydrolase family protein [Burkholderiaceae bacterium]|nr:SGNH/GDSL hydrolase family protein [Burkholderiaceae bacterium]
MLTTIALAPLLAWQGRRVRREALRLPEAGGARTGVEGEGSPLRLLLLGDSSAAGVGVADQADALAGRLVARLAADHRVIWRLEAGTGDRLADLLVRLDPLAREDFDAVVVAIGVNDATARTRVAAWRDGLRRLLADLRARFGDPLVLVCAIPPMQVFPALPRPLAGWLGMAAARLNEATHAVLAHEPRAHPVRFDFDPDPRWMCEDGFHPSAAGYHRWAGAVADALRERMAVAPPENDSDQGESS